MAARWLGLARPSSKKARARGRVRNTFQECLHALSACSALVIAAGMNFVLYPEALAQVIGGRPAIMGFAPQDPIRISAAPVELLPVNEDEVRLLAATAWGEARSEGEDGMRAVAHVMVNRVGDRFGDDLRTVILAPKQFSAWNRGDPNRPLVQNPERYARSGVNRETWETAQEVAREVLSGQSADPTDGALFYHTRAIRPYWSRYGVGRQVIGAHVFYRDVRNAPVRRARVTQTSAPAPTATTAGSHTVRAGRVNGVIQTASSAPSADLAPAVSAHTPSPEAAAAIAELPTSTSY